MIVGTDIDPEDIEQDCQGAASDLSTQKQSQVAATLNWWVIQK